jgi:predicted N-acetyltransferase YhbS
MSEVRKEMENNNQIEIQPMREEDLEKSAELSLEAFGKEGLGEPWTLDSSRDHDKELFNPEYSFVAKGGGQTVGVLLAFPATYELGPELFIDTIAVSKDKRGSGIGRKLWDKALENAKEKGLVGVRLVGNPKLPSFRWYQDELGLHPSGWIELTAHFQK